MSDVKIEDFELKPGFKGMATDTGSDQTMFGLNQCLWPFP